MGQYSNLSLSSPRLSVPLTLQRFDPFRKNKKMYIFFIKKCCSSSFIMVYHSRQKTIVVRLDFVRVMIRCQKSIMMMYNHNLCPLPKGDTIAIQKSVQLPVEQYRKSLYNPFWLPILNQS